MAPQNTAIKPGNSRLENVFLVPGQEVAFSETRPVPHGQVRIVWYDSPALGGARSMRVYTPPGYQASDEIYTDGPRRLSETLARHGIEHTFNETTGGHVWINWRLYLRDFAQLLFRD